MGETREMSDGETTSRHIRERHAPASVAADSSRGVYVTCSSAREAASARSASPVASASPGDTTGAAAAARAVSAATSACTGGAGGGAAWGGKVGGGCVARERACARPATSRGGGGLPDEWRSVAPASDGSGEWAPILAKAQQRVTSSPCDAEPRRRGWLAAAKRAATSCGECTPAAA